MRWWPWLQKQVETVTDNKTPEPPKSEPPEWFVKIYTDYLRSVERGGPR